MMAPRSFECRVPAKIVLSGEHSVLRGARAVALPYREMYLGLSFEPAVGAGLQVYPSDAQNLVMDCLRDLDPGVIDSIQGSLHLQSSIPRSAGLGSSAALSVALTRWLRALGQSSDRPLWTQAREFEDRFHGKSSGMDVAVIAEDAPIQFDLSLGPQVLKVGRLPKLTLHDTGERASTKECIERVQEFGGLKPERQLQLDRLMDQASAQVVGGLESYHLGEISVGMEQAARCFRDWGLETPVAARMIAELKHRGALSARLTGAGLGGFIVALWAE